ncbi:hypothetical protein LJR289_005994 [Pseudoduganella sp. LjRoot289]|uniref:hypothetical protein n=1 Tax=Pseudoduganella sp. LjRoot289 TaxID=3342314 RepID=UPI003ECDE134
MATEQDLQALSAADRERLERLAVLCERTSLETLYFVQRDGFEECEESVRETLLAEQSILEHGTIPHEEVMAETRRMVEYYARKKQSAK